jgi:hypothetical protein
MIMYFILVQPAPVSNLNAIATNMSCVIVKWDHSDYVHNKTFRVKYKSLNGLDFTERVGKCYIQGLQYYLIIR